MEWIRHDGRSAPTHLAGKTLEVCGPKGQTKIEIYRGGAGTSWFWRRKYVLFGRPICYDLTATPIVRYRVMPQKGFEQIARIVADPSIEIKEDA